jgi:hypothetical protein
LIATERIDRGRRYRAVFKKIFDAAFGIRRQS